MKKYLKDQNGLSSIPHKVKIFTSAAAVGNLEEGNIFIVQNDYVGFYHSGVIYKLFENVVSSTPKIGEIRMWPKSTPPNSSWAVCNGGTFDANECPILYSLLGGSTLPNFVNSTVIGRGTNAGTTFQYSNSIWTHTHGYDTTHSHYLYMNYHDHWLPDVTCGYVIQGYGDAHLNAVRVSYMNIATTWHTPNGSQTTVEAALSDKANGYLVSPNAGGSAGFFSGFPYPMYTHIEDSYSFNVGPYSYLGNQYAASGGTWGYISNSTTDDWYKGNWAQMYWPSTDFSTTVNIGDLYINSYGDTYLTVAQQAGISNTTRETGSGVYYIIRKK